MKLAFVAITKHGVKHAQELKRVMPEAELYISEKQKGEGQEGARYFGTLKELSASLWTEVDGLIYFVSLGAVVRTIAPFLKSKDEDPAVVTIDDGKRYAISLLSGHVGGANELSERVAAALGCQAIVTTASDARGSLAVDILGRELGWQIENKAYVTSASAAVVNERPVALIQESGEKNWWTRPTPLPAHIKIFETIAAAKAAGSFEAYLLVSDRSWKQLEVELGEASSKVVLYRPKSLSCGMGCDVGADYEELNGLLESGLEEAGLAKGSVRRLASIDLKAKEDGLHALAQALGVSIDFFSREELNAKDVRSEANPVVMKYTGAVGVCEPAAMLSAGVSELVLLKRKGPRSTLAIARKRFEA